MGISKSKPPKLSNPSQELHDDLKGEGRAQAQGWRFSSSGSSNTTFFSTRPVRNAGNPGANFVEKEKEKVPNPK